MTFGFTVGARSEAGRQDWKRYYDNSILVPGEETAALAAVAGELGVYVSIGVSERDAFTATLYNTNLIFSPEGRLDCVHRKLKPTGRSAWSGGTPTGTTSPSVTPPGAHGQPDLLGELYASGPGRPLPEGVTLYLSPNTNDNPEWQATIRHIALEGRCYFVNCNMYFTRDCYPRDLHCPQEIAALPEVVCRGGSCVVDPYGHYVTEPLWDREGILYAELDMEQVPASRMEFDPCGHYARPDVLRLEVAEE